MSSPFLQAKQPNRFLTKKTEGIDVQQGLPPAPTFPEISEDSIVANSEEFRALFEKGVKDPQSLTAREKQRFDKAMEFFPELRQYEQAVRQQEADAFGAEGQTPKKVPGFMGDVLGMTYDPGLAQRWATYAGDPNMIAKLGSDFLATTFRPLTQFFEERGDEIPHPVSPERDFESNPLTVAEQVSAQRFEQASEAEKGLFIAERLSHRSVAGVLGFFTAGLDPILNPQKYGTTTAKAFDETITGLTDMIAEAPDQIAQLSTIMHGGDPNNHITKLAENAGTLLNLPKLATAEDFDEARKQIKKDAINEMYLHPESLPFAAAIVWGIGKKASKLVPTKERPISERKLESSEFQKRLDKAEKEASVAKAEIKKIQKKETKVPSEERSVVKEIQESTRAELVIEANKLQEAKVSPADRIPPNRLLKLTRNELENVVSAGKIELTGKTEPVNPEVVKLAKERVSKAKGAIETQEVTIDKLERAGQDAKVAKRGLSELKSELSDAESRLSKIGGEKAPVEPTPTPTTKAEPKAPQKPAGELQTAKEVGLAKAEAITQEELTRAVKQKEQAEKGSTERDKSINELKESLTDATAAEKPVIAALIANLEAQKARDAAIIAEAESVIARPVKPSEREVSRETIKPKVTPEQAAEKPDGLKAPEVVKTGNTQADAARNLAHTKRFIKSLQERIAEETTTREQRAKFREQLIEARQDEARFEADFNRLREEAAAETKPKTEVPPATTPKDIFAGKQQFKMEPIKSLDVDTKRFQGRVEEFSQESVNRIVADVKAGKFDPDNFDPIHVWDDPNTGKSFVVGGHSRLEAAKILNQTDIPMIRRNFATEAEAIQWATEQSNRAATAEGLRSDLKVFQAMKKRGEKPEAFKLQFGKNYSDYAGYVNLDPTGKFMQVITDRAFEDAPYGAKWGKTVGELREIFPELTNAHEKQIFDQLYPTDKGSGLFNKMVTGELKAAVESQVTDVLWEPSTPITLKAGQKITSGSRARADTAPIVAKIEKLESLRKEARTTQEYELLTEEIAQANAAMAHLLQNQRTLELGAVGTPEAYLAMGQSIADGLSSVKGPPSMEVVPVKTTQHVAIERPLSDYHVGHAVQSPSLAWKKLNPAAGKIAEKMGDALRTANTELEHSNIALRETFHDLKVSIKQRHPGYFQYRKAFKKEQAKIFELLDRKVSDVELARLPEETRFAYHKTRAWYENYRQRIIAERRAQGLDVPDDWGVMDYMTHLFRGNWRLEENIEGNWRQVVGGWGETEATVMKLAKKRLLEDPTADLKVKWDYNVPQDMPIRISGGAFGEIVRRLSEVTEIDRAALKEMVATSGVGIAPARTKHFKFGQRRKGTPGFQAELLPVLETYAAVTERFLAMNKLRREAIPLLKQIDKSTQPRLYDRVSERLDMVTGKRIRGSQELDNLIRSMPFGISKHVKPMALERWARKATFLQAARLLSKPSSALLNRTQAFATLYPRVGSKIYFWAEKEALTARGRALAEENAITVFQPNFYSESMLSSRGISMSPKEIPLKLFQKAETQNRIVSFLAGRRYAKDVLKLSEEGAVAYGKGMVRLTQFDTSIADIQGVFNHPVMRVLGQFKSFQFKYIEQLTKLRGKEIPRAIGAHMILGGVKTIAKPFNWLKIYGMYEAYQYLSDNYGEEVADFVGFGLPSLIGADMSSSLAVDLLPEGETPQEAIGEYIIGPTGAMFSDLYETLDDAAKASPELTGDALLKGAQRLAPATRTLVAGYDWVKGETTLEDAQGKPMLENLTVREQFARTLGMQLLRKSLAYDLMDLSKEEQAIRVQAKRHAADAFIDGNYQNGMDALNKYNDDVMAKDKLILPLEVKEVDQYIRQRYSGLLKNKIEELVPEYNFWIKEELKKVTTGKK